MNGFCKNGVTLVMWCVNNCTCSVSEVAGWVVGDGEKGERETGKEAMVGACVRRRGEEKTHGKERGKEKR